jgi:hypothetical protein
MKITGSLSLIFFKEEELGGSLSLQHLKNPNQQFFKNLREPPKNGLYSQSDFYFCSKFWQ